MAGTVPHNKGVIMDLKHIKGIGPAKQEKLKAAGITDATALARCDVEQVAAATGLPTLQVRELKQRAAAHSLLADLRGFGPASLAALSEQSSAALSDLYQASGEWLAAQAKVAQARLEEARVRAEQVARHVAEGARTPAGRSQLLLDAQAQAAKAAKEGEALARKALAATQELAKEAEAKVREASAQVEATVKAEAAKAAAAVKAEAIKAKARAERVVAQTRQRLNRAQ